MRKRATLFYGSVITGLTLLSGCVFQGEQTLQEMDPPQQQTTGVEEKETTNTVEETTENVEVVEMVERQLYLLDENGMVVPQTLKIPKLDSTEVALQVAQYLVKGGPVTEFLPSGFQAVLPAGTEINSLNLQTDGTLVVDVSKEFSEYRPEDELKILQALTFTLTQFESVERIKLQINGYDTDVMPVNKTPISDGYSRANGINIHIGDVVDLTNSESITVYYPAQHDDQVYYVPVTKRIDSKGDSVYEAVVNTLVEGPGLDLNLLSVFNDGVELKNTPEYTNGVLTLTFNENILNIFEEQSVISQMVMDTLVLSLTEQKGVEAVSIQVENFDELYNEEGKVLNEPVTRPQTVNTRRF